MWDLIGIVGVAIQLKRGQYQPKPSMVTFGAGFEFESHWFWFGVLLGLFGYLTKMQARQVSAGAVKGKFWNLIAIWILLKSNLFCVASLFISIWNFVVEFVVVWSSMQQGKRGQYRPKPPMVTFEVEFGFKFHRHPIDFVLFSY